MATRRAMVAPGSIRRGWIDQRAIGGEATHCSALIMVKAALLQGIEP
jgi:hypothetical protein